MLNEGKIFLDKYDNISLKFYLGSMLLQILIYIDLVEIDYRGKIDNKDLTILIPSKSILDCLPKKGQDILILDLPIKIPMLVEPKKYERVETEKGIYTEKLGGYLLNDIEINTPLIIHN